MKVKYQIDESILKMQLTKEYDIEIESVSFIPFGDSAYSYRVNCTNGQKFYMKLFNHSNDRQRKSISRLDYYLPLTWRMYQEGLFQNLTYPIKTVTGEFKTNWSSCTVVLFNFIEGETLAEAYPFPNEILERIAQSAALIHKCAPYIASSTLLKETYDISFASDLENCISALEGAKAFEDPVQQALRDHVLPKKEQIFAILNYVRELRLLAMVDSRDMVLCHGDLWGGNLICHETELYIIDWESVLLAPPELDLAGYIGAKFDVFFASYEKERGLPVTVNLDILRFYCYRHHLRNLTNWMMNILYRNGETIQSENDLDMILHHCMNRWDRIEPDIEAVNALLQQI